MAMSVKEEVIDEELNWHAIPGSSPGIEGRNGNTLYDCRRLSLPHASNEALKLGQWLNSIIVSHSPFGVVSTIFCMLMPAMMRVRKVTQTQTTLQKVVAGTLVTTCHSRGR